MLEPYIGDPGDETTYDPLAEYVVAVGEIFDCDKCGDGDALRDGEECAYCGRVQ